MQGLILVITMIFLLALLLLFFYSWVSFRERNSLKSMNSINEELISSQARFFESTAKADHEIRAMRHDMKNNIQVLMLLLEKGEYDKMREYLEEMGENLSGTEVSAHTGDMIADAIIADKKVLAKSKNINLKYSGRIEGVSITPVDMCKILANLLDNAIEAVSKPELSELDESLKVIELQLKKTENFFMISVTNPCIKAPQIKDGKIMTSKKDSKNHGFGTQNIGSAAANYGGELSVSCEEKPYGFLFRSEVVFPIE
jgi:sensor histidine kinase regulating citrate/malate metabolism